MITITTINRPSSWGFIVRRDGEVLERQESVYRRDLGTCSPPMAYTDTRFGEIISAAEARGESVTIDHVSHGSR